MLIRKRRRWAFNVLPLWTECFHPPPMPALGPRFPRMVVCGGGALGRRLGLDGDPGPSPPERDGSFLRAICAALRSPLCEQQQSVRTRARALSRRRPRCPWVWALERPERRAVRVRLGHSVRNSGAAAAADPQSLGGIGSRIKQAPSFCRIHCGVVGWLTRRCRWRRGRQLIPSDENMQWSVINFHPVDTEEILFEICVLFCLFVPVIIL